VTTKPEAELYVIVRENEGVGGEYTAHLPIGHMEAHDHADNNS